MGSRSQDFNSHGSQTKSRMGKGQNEGGFSAEQIEMYKECFKLMDVNKDGTIDKNDLRGAFDHVGVLMSEGSLMAFWERSLDPAPLITWLRCSKRRWLEMATTPMTSSSRLSRLTTPKARLTSRCSSTPSEPGETR